jgi:hypothetical protein
MGVPGSFVWSETDIETEALAARQSMFHMKPRVLDKSNKVRGVKNQRIDIPEVQLVEVFDVGAGGSVNPQGLTPSSVSLIVDQYKEATRDFEDVDEIQEKYDKKKDWSWQTGEAHGRNVEDTLLALEVGIAAGANRINVAGNLANTDIMAGKIVLDQADVPLENRYAYLSANQAGQLVLQDAFRNLDFIGPGKMPTVTGTLRALYGMEPLWGNRCRRRDVTGTTRTINFLAHKSWAACAVQQGLSTKITQVDLAERIIVTQLFGVTRTRPDHIVILQSVNA